MELIEWFVMASSAGCVWYLLAAFRSRPPKLVDTGIGAVSDPSERAAAAVREIEFDYAAGKLSAEDYETIRRKTVEDLAVELKSKAGEA